jgi:3-phosphoshikimate 1-carboxyvinyltransferase
MNQKFVKIKKVKGTLSLPGDKSISHRAVMLAAIAEGKSRIINCLESDDVNSTINIFRQLGIKITQERNEIIVHGKGFQGLLPPTQPLDAGNSGTTARLISGILAGQKFPSTIVGDESLSNRPMKRVIDPLKEFGALISCSPNGSLPINILSSRNLKAANYKLKVASAQVKSALIFAALHCEESSVITETEITRNHTENMLELKVEENKNSRKIFVSKDDYPIASEYFVPSDISTASYFIVHALLLKDSFLKIENVSLNPTRTGLLELLKKMGGKIQVENEKISKGEKYGTVAIWSSELKNIEIPKEIIPNIIDEIPILSIAGIFAEGDFHIRNAAELRFKESDRIESVCSNLKAAGLNVKEFKDGFKFSGGVNNKNITFKSFGDHRIALAFGILSSLIDGKNSVDGFEAVSISNPKFVEQLKSISVS